MVGVKLPDSGVTWFYQRVTKITWHGALISPSRAHQKWNFFYGLPSIDYLNLITLNQKSRAELKISANH